MSALSVITTEILSESNANHDGGADLLAGVIAEIIGT
jgi:hypothetical protein